MSQPPSRPKHSANRRKTDASGKTKADKYLEHLSYEVNRACNKWLRSRNLATSFNPKFNSTNKPIHD